MRLRWGRVAPCGHAPPAQVMVLGLDYLQSAALTAAAVDGRTLDIVEHLLDQPEGVELFGKGAQTPVLLIRVLQTLSGCAWASSCS